ncbi:MAG: EF hand [Syntrophorhabdus sp. PtaU1.Bin050]|jgi:Ca2+-binding EF-hand superfamily protein|nr:MAG: EF hand [Syntrophorhabdus sp. PtaU1.Bin050]
MTQMRQQMFSKVDANGDGKLDSDELAEMVANGPKNGPSVDEILSQSDTDGDGSVSESEFEATAPPPPPMQGMGGMSSADFLEQLFSDADTNGDGVISEDEMSTVVANGPANGPSVDDIFAKLDTDGDGSISQTEFEAGAPQGNGPVQSGNPENQLVQSLLEALNGQDATGSSTSTNGSTEDSSVSSLVEMLTSSLKAYMEASGSSFSQYGTQSLLGSSLYA